MKKSCLPKIALTLVVLGCCFIVFVYKAMNVLAPVLELRVPVTHLPLKYEGVIEHSSGELYAVFHTSRRTVSNVNIEQVLQGVKFEAKLSNPKLGTAAVSLEDGDELRIIGFRRTGGGFDAAIRFPRVVTGSYDLHFECSNFAGLSEIAFYRER